MPSISSTLPLRHAARYTVPLREGGSLPAIVEMAEGDRYVVKFRGAGQGARPLIAEIIVGELARALGLPMPPIALVELDPEFGRTEGDPEIQDILEASRGVNVGLEYLEGSYTFDPLAHPVDPDLASRIVWLDAWLVNVDRTPRNPNLLVRPDGLWLIDHGAALYVHYNWSGLSESVIASPFPQIKDHVLLPFAEQLEEADRAMTEGVTPDLVDDILGHVPDLLFLDAPAGVEPAFPTADEHRAAYRRYLLGRLAGDRPFLQEALAARTRLLTDRPRSEEYRR